MNPSPTLWQRLAGGSRSLAITQTLIYYAAFIGLGLTAASLGPTLLGLAEQTGSPLSQISYLFTARSFGYMIGSFTGGRLFDRLPGHRTMAIALLIVVVMLAGVPLIPLLLVMVLAMLGIGFMEAVVDVGGNTLIVWVHRERVGPYMNGLHLFFAVGALLSPLLVALGLTLSGGIALGYWILAVLLVPVALRLLYLPNPQPIVSHAERASARPNYVLLLLLALFFVMVAGAEHSFSGWIAAYSVKTGFADAELGALVNSAFWGAFMLGRLAAIPIAARVRPRVIIFGDLFLAFAGIGLMLLFPSSVIGLWGGTILFGLGIASAFPTLLTFAGRHMVITGAVTGWFFVGASIGGMTLPWLIGQLFEPVSPLSVLWVISGALLAGLVVFVLILGFIKRNKTGTQTH